MDQEVQAQEAQQTQEAQQELSWQDGPPQGEPCTLNRCSHGHTWPIALQVGRCPGCQGVLVAIRQENCPYCNEPSIQLKVRIDHVPSRGGQFIGACRGASAPWSIHTVVIEKEPWWDKAEEVKPDGE